MWANYRALGYRRMIYVNTASVLGTVTGELTPTIGDGPRVTAVLLTCSDATARRRLAQRETGTGLDRHIERSDLMARKLDRHAPGWVHRVLTDDRAVADIAAEVISLAGWSGGCTGRRGRRFRSGHPDSHSGSDRRLRCRHGGLMLISRRTGKSASGA